MLVESVSTQIYLVLGVSEAAQVSCKILKTRTILCGQPLRFPLLHKLLLNLLHDVPFLIICKSWKYQFCVPMWYTSSSVYISNTARKTLKRCRVVFMCVFLNILHCNKKNERNCNHNSCEISTVFFETCCFRNWDEE